MMPEFVMAPGGQFGIYLHVPFCGTRCGYCDFNTYTPAELRVSADLAETGDAYVDAALAEIDLAAAVLGANAPAVSTVFVGGGTPTLLAAARSGEQLLHTRSESTFGLAAERRRSPPRPTRSRCRRLPCPRCGRAGSQGTPFGMQSAAPTCCRPGPRAFARPSARGGP